MLERSSVYGLTEVADSRRESGIANAALPGLHRERSQISRKALSLLSGLSERQEPNFLKADHLDLLQTPKASGENRNTPLLEKVTSDAHPTAACLDLCSTSFPLLVPLGSGKSMANTGVRAAQDGNGTSP